MEIFLGPHHFLLIKKHTPPPLFFSASAVLSIRNTEKLSDGVTAASGSIGVSHVSVKQRMLQSLMSCWKLILALRSSILFSKDWTLASKILGSVLGMCKHTWPIKLILILKQRLSRWIVDTDTLAYSSLCLQCPISVRAHSTRGIASSWAWSITEICTAAGWASLSTFAKFYNLDVPALQARVLSA